MSSAPPKLTATRISIRVARRAALILACAGVVVGFVFPVSMEPFGSAGALAADNRIGSPVPDPEWTPASQEALSALSKPTIINLVDIRLNECLRFLKEYHKVPLRVDDDAIQAAGIAWNQPATLIVEGTSLRAAFQILLEPSNLDVHIDEDGLVVSTRQRAAAKLHEFSYALRDVTRAGIPLTDLVEAISQTVDPPSWQKNGGTGSLRVESGTMYVRQRADVHESLEDLFRELFDALRDPSDAAYDDRVETAEYPVGHWQELGTSNTDLLRWIGESLIINALDQGGQEGIAIKGDQLILTQPGWMQTAAQEFFLHVNRIRQDRFLKFRQERKPIQHDFSLAGCLLSRDAKRRITDRRLRQPLTVDFRELPFEDTIDFARKSSRAKFYYSRELRDMVGVWESRVTLRADKVPLASLLDQLLHPLKLDWYLFDADFIVVASRTMTAGHMEPHVYRTRELLADGQTNQGLMAKISAIEPDSWAALGGPGQLRPLPEVLIVTQNRRVHEQIGRLLASLQGGRDKSKK